MKILVAVPAGMLRDSFMPPEVFQRIKNMGDVAWNTTEIHFTSEELKENLKDKEVCFTSWGCSRLDEYVLESAGKLRLVAHTGGSVAPYVSDFLYERGIRVISGNQIFAESVAEGCIAYMLSSLREIPKYSQMVQQGGWTSGDPFNQGLLDQRVGLVGFGAVAKHLVKLLKPFRAKIKVYDPYISAETCTEHGVESVSLEEIFATSKIISIHAPKIPETYHMIGKELLARVQEGALLVNTARGNIIDEEALADELEKNRFKAALDVYEVEPLPESSKLRGLDNVILIPHMAGPTMDRRKFVTMAVLDDVDRYFAGEPLKYEISREYAAKMTR
jgi:phosphoglycerate dehydrogenase-like enzyme